MNILFQPTIQLPNLRGKRQLRPSNTTSHNSPVLRLWKVVRSRLLILNELVYVLQFLIKISPNGVIMGATMTAESIFGPYVSFRNFYLCLLTLILEHTFICKFSSSMQSTEWCINLVLVEGIIRMLSRIKIAIFQSLLPSPLGNLL